MGNTPLQAALKLVQGETISRASMPGLQDTLRELVNIQHNTKDCINQIKRAIKMEKK